MDFNNKNYNERRFNLPQKNWGIETTKLILSSLKLANQTQMFNDMLKTSNEMDVIVNNSDIIKEIANMQNQIVNNTTITAQYIIQLENFFKNIRPIDFIEKFTLTQSSLQLIHNSFKLINWNEINISLNLMLQTISPFQFDIVIIEKQFYTHLIYGYVCLIDDDELSSIFTYEFIFKLISEDWWIIPRFDLDFYKKMSKNIENDSNQIFLTDFYDNPNLINDMISKWNIISDDRRKIINQAFFNYKHGNYEICVITLILQIEGIMKEKLDFNKKSSELRALLEKKIK